jgi:HPt (histidine-containing phosphotransfer) domain-containing protein
MAEALDADAVRALYRAVGDDADFVGELVDEYLADAPRQLDAMRAAVASGSIDELTRASHTLKGTSLNVGAAALAEICRGIEQRARAGEWTGVEGLIGEAEQAFGAASAALDEARANRWEVR